MKLYISADIEGVAGVSHWDATRLNDPEFQEARELMTNEVLAACEAAIDSGFKEIVIKDAHGSARNIISSHLPENTTLIRGWSGHPYTMMQEIDNTFDAALFIGFHSSAGSTNNPLAHTISLNIEYIKINGIYASEFLINLYTASLEDVPVLFLSGDKHICQEAKDISSMIETVSVSEGIGASSICFSPKQSVKKIKDGVTKALTEDFNKCKFTLPKHFKIEIKYNNPSSAYRASFYPGIKEHTGQIINYESDTYLDVLKMFKFVL